MIKIGIIGAGRIGRVHITSITTRVHGAVIKTVADPFLDEDTAAWAKSMGVGHTTKDYREIIEDPEIDAVLICSPTDTHSKISLEAIRSGMTISIATSSSINSGVRKESFLNSFTSASNVFNTLSSSCYIISLSLQFRNFSGFLPSA